MTQTGDETIIAERLVEVLSAKHTLRPPEAMLAPVANLSGSWEIEIQYSASQSTHILHLQQQGNDLGGTQQGNCLARDIAGTISGDAVTLLSNVTERHGDALRYRFTGKVSGEAMSGTLDMGEYLTATWTGRRYGSRPVAL
jgi:D-glucosaminate-6-phosphate ammonia-lyase